MRRRKPTGNKFGHRPFRKDDLVECIAGDDKGKKGKVLQVIPETGRALVEGLNLIKKAMRKTQDRPQGGIVEREGPIAISNLRRVTAGKGAEKSA